MAGVKISNLPAATTPLSGTESVPVVQSGVTVKATPANINAVATYTSTGTGAVSRLVSSKLGDFVSVKDFGAVGDGVADDTAAIQAAIDALAGSFDVTANYSGNQYSGKPSQILYFPPGIYNVTSRILVEKNNVAIRGAGWFSSTIRYVGTSIVNEVIRFRNSHYGELSDIGIDGGMPFTPTRSETYGAKAGLCCDLTPFFTSRNLYICNTRLQGLRAIHVWESFFENLQIRNTGWFSDGTLAGRGAAIHFSNDAAVKESSDALGSGYESSNITFVKAKLVPVGCLVRCDVLAANVTFINPITENRDFASYFSALGESKWYLNNTDNFRVIGGYCYGHEHSFACNAKLFEVVAQNPGLHIDGFYWYAPSATGGYFPEITTGFDIDPVYPVQIDNFVINDVNGKLTTPLTISANGPIVYGDITYKSPSAVLPTALFSGTSINRWNGKIRVINSSSPAAGHTEWDYTEAERKYDTLAGSMLEAYQCRAWVCFNGVTGAILAKSNNVSGITKNSTGNYTVNFSPSMPDANFAAVVSCNVLNSASERPEIGAQTASSVNVANRAGATYYDPSIFNVAVFR